MKNIFWQSLVQSWQTALRQDIAMYHQWIELGRPDLARRCAQHAALAKREINSLSGR